MTALIDITGQVFGSLTVIRLADKPGKYGQRFWECLCECGNTTYIVGNYLRTGNTQSCGCLRTWRDTQPKKHGMNKTKEYRAWNNMLTRCYRTNAKGYEYYGDRGIKVLYGSFEEFYADVGPAPSPKHSMERNNNDGHYEPGNCRWATDIEQANNRRPMRWTRWNKPTSSEPAR